MQLEILEVDSTWAYRRGEDEFALQRLLGY